MYRVELNSRTARRAELELQPFCRVADEWHEMLKPLRKRDPQKWARFVSAVFDYGYAHTSQSPNFEDDTELQELWSRTNARPYNAARNLPGWIKVRRAAV